MIKNNTPQLRFSEFADEWQEKKLSKVLNHFKLGGNYANSEKITKKPLIKMGNLGRGNFNLNKIEYIIEKEIINENDLIKKDDLFFNTRNTLDLVGKVAIWNNELPKAYYNSNLMRLKFDCNKYMNFYLNSNKGLKLLKRIATGTTSVAAIYTKDLLNIKLYIPSKPEQQKIADFLGKVDDKIEKMEKRKELFREYKKGIMQKVFPSAGGQVPQIRFCDENGKQYPDWGEKKLGDLVNFKNGKSFENKIDKNGKYSLITLNSINIDGELQINHKNVANTDNSLSKDDVIIVMSDVAHGNFLGLSAVIPNNMFVLNQRMGALKPKKINSIFLRYYINNNQLYFKRHGQGSSQLNLSKGDILKFKIYKPIKDEQQKIANFLTSLDNKIDQINNKLVQAKLFKKSLLQKMFI